MSALEILEEVYGKKYPTGVMHTIEGKEFIQDAESLIELLWSENKFLINELENK